jgi:hypothetical protein
MRTKSIRQQDEQFREALKAVPVRNGHVRAAPLPEDPKRLEVEVELLYRTPLQRLLRRLLRAAPTKRYRLDRLGTRVYGMIDGRKTFGELVDEFAAAEKLTFFESRALLGQYLQHLSRRGLVVATLRRPAP